jgi:hypothetical protein
MIALSPSGQDSLEYRLSLALPVRLFLRQLSLGFIRLPDEKQPEEADAGDTHNQSKPVHQPLP